MNTLTHLSLQCPCCITHHTHTLMVCDFYLVCLFCCLPLEISTGVLNPSLPFSLHSFFLTSLHQLLLIQSIFHVLIHFLPTPTLTTSFTTFPPFYHFPPGSSAPAILPFFLSTCCLPLLTPTFQFSYVRAPCSASSQPPRSWRQSISLERGVRTRCRLGTGSTSCRGHHIGQRCCTSMPPGMTTDRTESPPPISK